MPGRTVPIGVAFAEERLPVGVAVAEGGYSVPVLAGAVPVVGVPGTHNPLSTAVPLMGAVYVAGTLEETGVVNVAVAVTTSIWRVGVGARFCATAIVQASCIALFTKDQDNSAYPARPQAEPHAFCTHTPLAS